MKNNMLHQNIGKNMYIRTMMVFALGAGLFYCGSPEGRNGTSLDPISGIVGDSPIMSISLIASETTHHVEFDFTQTSEPETLEGFEFQVKQGDSEDFIDVSLVCDQARCTHENIATGVYTYEVTVSYSGNEYMFSELVTVPEVGEEPNESPNFPKPLLSLAQDGNEANTVLVTMSVKVHPNFEGFKVYGKKSTGSSLERLATIGVNDPSVTYDLEELKFKATFSHRLEEERTGNYSYDYIIYTDFKDAASGNEPNSGTQSISIFVMSPNDLPKHTVQALYISGQDHKIYVNTDFDNDVYLGGCTLEIKLNGAVVARKTCTIPLKDRSWTTSPETLPRGTYDVFVKADYLVDGQTYTSTQSDQILLPEHQSEDVSAPVVVETQCDEKENVCLLMQDNIKNLKIFEHFYLERKKTGEPNHTYVYLGKGNAYVGFFVPFIDSNVDPGMYTYRVSTVYNLDDILTYSKKMRTVDVTLD